MQSKNLEKYVPYHAAFAYAAKDAHELNRNVKAHRPQIDDLRQNLKYRAASSMRPTKLRPSHFGDGATEDSSDAAGKACNRLAENGGRMTPYHLDRLQRDGFLLHAPNSQIPQESAANDRAHLPSPSQSARTSTTWARKTPRRQTRDKSLSPCFDPRSCPTSRRKSKAQASTSQPRPAKRPPSWEPPHGAASNARRDNAGMWHVAQATVSALQPGSETR